MKRKEPPCLNCETEEARDLEPFGKGNGFISGFCSIACWIEAEGIDVEEEEEEERYDATRDAPNYWRY